MRWGWIAKAATSNVSVPRLPPREFGAYLNLSPPSGLPKALREALEYLASEAQVRELAAIVQEQLRLSDPDAGSQEEAPEMDLNLDRPPALEWSEGVEEF